MAKNEKSQLISSHKKGGHLSKLKVLSLDMITERDKIDWERIQVMLGENIASEFKHFGMNRPRVQNCVPKKLQPSIAKSVQPKDECEYFESTQNLFVEEDNLEVMKQPL